MEKKEDFESELRKELPQIAPWDVSRAIDLLDRRINQITDFSHQTQSVVKEFHQSILSALKDMRKDIETISNLVNSVLSPSVNEVKKTLETIRENQIKLEGKIDLIAVEFDKRQSVTDKYIEGEFARFNKVVDQAGAFLWKLAGTGVIAFIGMVIGIAFYVHMLKETLVIPHVQLDPATMRRRK